MAGHRLPPMTHSPESQSPALEQRFQDLVSRCAPDVEAGELYRVLAGKYAEPHRSYHTLEHIRHCLAQLDGARHLAGDPDAIELAIWFHDAVYEVDASDNELRSAQLFDSLLGPHLPHERAARIHRLIRETEHPSEPEDNDARLMVDIDLSSFGLPWDEFMRDTRAVCSELAHLSEPQFVAGKCRFLNALMSRSSIYLTPHFRERLEARARSNIERHLRELDTEA
jgi:predicted metal-dependent HD superfamily phosphohydrolase